MSFPKVHFYGQSWWHDAAILTGDREGLEKVRDAINAVLASEEPQASASTSVFCEDGEGYDLIVLRLSAETLGQLRLPYTDETAQFPGLDPWSLVTPTKGAEYEDPFTYPLREIPAVTAE